MVPAILLNNPLASGLGIVAALAIAAGVQTIRLAWAEGETAACRLAREENRRKAEEAARKALQEAQQRSDAIITEQAKALADTAAKVGGITEKIIHVPVTTACAQSPAMRAVTNGVRELFSSSGGKAPAGSSAPPSVR